MERLHSAGSDTRLARAADVNFVAAMEHFGRTVAGARVAHFGPVTAVVTGIPARSFNAAFVVDDAASPADIEAAVGWLSGSGLPFVIHVRDDLDPALITAVDGLGLDRDPTAMPSLALEPIPERPAPPAGLTIERVDAAGLAVHQAILASVFQVPLRVVRDLLPPIALRTEGFTAFTGWLAGRPVATSAALRTGDVVGIYDVGTIADVRRRGLGTALTWRAIEAGADAGCHIAILQSTAMGLPVYLAMGFRHVASYLEYAGHGGRRGIAVR